MAAEIVKFKRQTMPNGKANVPHRWMKGYQLAEFWAVSPSTISRLAGREDDPLPADTGLGPRRYDLPVCIAWRERQNAKKRTFRR